MTLGEQSNLYRVAPGIYEKLLEESKQLSNGKYEILNNKYKYERLLKQNKLPVLLSSEIIQISDNEQALKYYNYYDIAVEEVIKRGASMRNLNKEQFKKAILLQFESSLREKYII